MPIATQQQQRPFVPSDSFGCFGVPKSKPTSGALQGQERRCKEKRRRSLLEDDFSIGSIGAVVRPPDARAPTACSQKTGAQAEPVRTGIKHPWEEEAETRDDAAGTLQTTATEFCPPVPTISADVVAVEPEVKEPQQKVAKLNAVEKEERSAQDAEGKGHKEELNGEAVLAQPVQVQEDSEKGAPAVATEELRKSTIRVEAAVASQEVAAAHTKGTKSQGQSRQAKENTEAPKAAKAKRKAEAKPKASATPAEKKASRPMSRTDSDKEKHAYKGNYVKQDLRRNGRKGVAVGTTERGRVARRHVNKSGRLKASYRQTADVAQKVKETGRISRRQAHQLRNSRSVAERCLAAAPEPLVQAFSSSLPSSIVDELSDCGDLGDIAECRPPDILTPVPEKSIMACSSDAAGDDVGAEADSVPRPALPSSLEGKDPKDYSPADLQLILHDVFRHEAFRPGQQEAVSNILAGIKTLLLLATGCGKSLCYQLPAFVLREEGLTLVISPLVSLMSDQLMRLPKCLRGAIVSSQQSREQSRTVMRAVRARLVDVLFISPERLSMWAFDGCGLPPIALACIDEAHCVSEWSHNFRPDYLRLHEHLAASLGARRLLALTATATRPTVESIHNILQLESIVRADRSFTLKELLTESSQPRVQRMNLAMDVRQAEDDEGQFRELQRLLLAEDMQRKPVIVYVWKRAVADQLAKRLSRVVRGGVRAYHGSLAPEARNAVQDAFMVGTTRVVVATMAFGMGLDKPDIRMVVHFNLPKSIENFIQETGRCSRDGEPGRCVALVNSQDFKAVRWMESGGGGATTHRAVVRKLLAMIFKKEGKTCEHFEVSDEKLVPRPDGESTPELSQNEACRQYLAAFDEQEAARSLSCPVDELHSVLVHLGYRAKSHLTLYSRFPTKLKLRFFKTDPKELEEIDPLLKRVMPLAKKVSGVYTIPTAKALSVLGGQPGQLSNALWAARGDEFSVEKAGYGFMVAVHQQPSEAQLEAWATEISEINSIARANSIDKVDAVYMALTRAAEASRAGGSDATGSHELLAELIDSYFAATKDPSAVVAGGEEARARRLQAALGSAAFLHKAGPPSATQSQAPAATREKLADAVFMSVTKILVRAEWRTVLRQDQAAVAHSVAQFLAGIGSVVMPTATAKRYPSWAHFKQIGDFNSLQELVTAAFNRKMKTGQTLWATLVELLQPAAAK
mmetsp:Transcript_12412/g.29225  ORF Transcript_12412/g.29225 Transcript_12412/m.29225 type:complete len:1197 (+) Transcript_12412:48-3638(+)